VRRRRAARADAAGGGRPSVRPPDLAREVDEAAEADADLADDEAAEADVDPADDGAAEPARDLRDDAPEPVLAVDDAVRAYRIGGDDGTEVRALKGVTFAVDEGEFVTIVGPSGSGKSTLLHLLGALDRPTSGSVRFSGRDVADLDDAALAELRNAQIGFVFQQFQLLPRTAALANVALPLVYAGVPKAERRERAAAALEAVGLAHRLDHRPAQLSGGEQQRVAIARALVTRPRLLLADEPTGNLDSATGVEIMALLTALNAEQGVALVVITHDLEVAALAPRRIHIRDGRIERDVVAAGAAR
jgi:putative ABC transport system ATP-binding protein